MQQLDDPQLLFNDLFCGGGGVTSGVEEAEVFNNKAAKVITCVNHDANAIRSHEANHPHCKHYTEDIRTLDLTDLTERLCQARQLYPRAKMAMWASVECINFSKAKGGLPKNADSRTLADHLDRYVVAEMVNGGYDYIFVENVEEFMSWGPLDAKGKPISKLKGIDYLKWVEYIKSFGFNYEYRILNAADYGAYTSRKRYFGVFYRPNLPLIWPIATHAKKPVAGLQKWKPVREVLDLHLMGENIFERERGTLAEATLERIYEGLNKHLPETHNPAFLDYYYGHGYSSSLDNPSGTLTTKDRINLVHFLLFPQWGSKCSHSIDKPSPVLPARMDKMCPYVIDAQLSPAPIEIKDGDSHFTKKIKEFMIEKGIAEVHMRGISIPEMLRITGFDENYILIGTIAERKKYIGNAVPVRLAQVIVESVAQSLMQPLESELAA